jgi:hypothetical protein
MKLVLKWTLIVFGIILLLLITIPFLFKDKLIEAFDTALQKNLKANVYYDTGKFSVGIFKNFPNLTLSVGDFGIEGIDEFSGDTLLHVGQFDLVVNLKSVLFGNAIQIDKVGFDGLRLKAKVLRSGKANYDIVRADTTTLPDEESKEAAAFALKVKSWYLRNTDIHYSNQADNLVLTIKGLQHSGEGDFTQDIFDLRTQTAIRALSFVKDSINFLSNKRLEADLELNCNLPEQKYTFGKNKVQLNDFAIHFEGMVQLQAHGINLNVNCSTDNNEFKSVLSLVPGIYTEAFKDIQTKGSFSFAASAKGVFDSISIPAYTATLKIEKGGFKYPNLPQAAEDIVLDFEAVGQGGSLEQSVFNLKNFAMRLGKNPISAQALIKGINIMQIKAQIDALLNLEDIMAVVPINDLTLKGLLKTKLSADGVLNMAEKQFPVANVVLNLSNGFVKSAAFPQPIENIQIDMTARNEGGKTENTVINLENFDFVLDGESFECSAHLKNLDNITYDAKAKGTINLEKVTKIFPLPGMKLAGRILAEISTAGQMADIEAGRYDKLPTSGNLQMQNFEFSSSDYPQGIKITEARMDFDPKTMKISKLSGFLGKSDMRVEGVLQNYIAYIFKDETLKGNFSFNSTSLDANEWLPTDDTPAAESQAVQPDATPAQIPTNIDFIFQSAIGTLKYDNMVMTNFKGIISLKNGIATMEQLKFNMLGGSVDANGSYDARNVAPPAYTFNLDLKNISVSEAYSTFNTIQVLAPVAKKIDGRFSTKFALKGKMLQDMSPDLSSLTGQGFVNLAQGSLKDFTLAKGINSLTKSNLPSDVPLRDILIKASIANGRVNFEPFSFQAGSLPISIGGSNGLDGTIDYLVKTSLPSGAAGNAAASVLSGITGTTITNPQNVKIDVKVTGTHAAPKYTIARVDAGGADNQAKQAVQEQVNKAKAEAEARARAEAERLQKEAQEKAEAARKEAEERARAEAEKAKNQAKERTNQEAKKLKEKFKIP